jgi:hypothetical protein
VPQGGAALDAELWDAARRGFTKANTRRLAVRAVSLTLDMLEIEESQLDLWDVSYQSECEAIGPSERGEGTCHPERSEDSTRHGPLHHVRQDGGRDTRLQHAMDRIRTRYGARALLTTHLNASSRNP